MHHPDVFRGTEEEIHENDARWLEIGKAYKYLSTEFEPMENRLPTKQDRARYELMKEDHLRRYV